MKSLARWVVAPGMNRETNLGPVGDGEVVLVQIDLEEASGISEISLSSPFHFRSPHSAI